VTFFFGGGGGDWGGGYNEINAACISGFL